MTAIGITAAIAASIIAVNSQMASAEYSDYQHELISKNESGQLGNQGSSSPSTSGDGRYIAFDSEANNLVSNDTNGVTDIFLKDRASGAVRRISVTNDGVQGNNHSYKPRISSNGRYVVFSSNATNFVANDTNDTVDAFRYDLQDNSITLVTSNVGGAIGNLGGQHPDVSADGTFVSFGSSSNNLVPNYDMYNQRDEIFVKNMVTGVVKLVSASPTGVKGDMGSGVSRISCDGTRIAFGSAATNLNTEPSNDPQTVYQKQDIFLATQNGQGYVIDEITDFANYHSGDFDISCDGKFIALSSSATNLVSESVPTQDGRIYRYDVVNDTFRLISARVTNGQTEVVGLGDHPSISGDGRYISFAGTSDSLDPNTYNNFSIGSSGIVYVSDAENRVSRILPVNSYNKVVKATDIPSISDNGNVVSYYAVSHNYTLQNWFYEDFTRAILLEDTTPASDVYMTRNVLKALDTTVPTITGQAADVANPAGWLKADTTINWTTTDPAPSSGVPTQPPATVASLEGITTYTSSPSCDPAGNCATGSLELKIDKTGPTLGVVSWTTNPKTISGSSTVSIPASDSLSGVAGGEYFIGTDPGQGNGATLTLSASKLTTTFGTNFVSGVYEIGLRSKDVAGNWSAVTKTLLVVFEPSNLGATGKNKKDLVPSLAKGDVLPGLTAAGQTDAADYGFTVDFKNGALDPNNDFQFVYATGSQCNSPHGSNCHNFSVNATGFSWLVIDQANNSRARFQGVATVSVDGVTTSNPFSVVSIDGDRTTPVSDDNLQLKIFAPGADPATATPLYKVSSNVTKTNGVSIR